jgi:hypothetical protein
MPSHETHTYIDRLFLGKAYWKVHRMLDSAYPYLHGRHRIFWHDPTSAYAIAADAYPGDPNAQSSALIHIELDKQCSADPVFRANLEWLAKREAQRRKRARKRKSGHVSKQKKTAPPDELQTFNHFLKKLAEIRRLTQLTYG